MNVEAATYRSPQPASPDAIRSRRAAVTLRTVAKEAIYGTVHASGLTLLGRWRQRQTLTVFTYHSFGPADSCSYLRRMPMARFEAQLRYLRRHYRIVALEEGLRTLRHGPDDRRPMAALTVDDGYGDNFDRLFPFARDHALPVTVFVATDYIDNGRLPWPTRIAAILRFATRERLFAPLDLALGSDALRAKAGRALRQYFSKLPTAAREDALVQLAKDLAPSAFVSVPPLTWAQIRRMREHGVAFGSHTCFHGWLDRLESDDVAEELVQSRRRIETETGAPCRLLAYPNGNWNARIAGAAARAGYEYALTQERGTNRRADLRPHALYRRNVPSDERLGSFACRASGMAI